MIGTDFHFRPLMESLDGRLLPGGISGGVLKTGWSDLGVAGVAIVAHPTADLVAVANVPGVGADGVLSDSSAKEAEGQIPLRSRGSTEEIPQGWRPATGALRAGELPPPIGEEIPQ